MPARVYGVLSLVTFAGAVAIAVWAGWRESPALGVGYAALALVSLLVIARSSAVNVPRATVADTSSSARSPV